MAAICSAGVDGAGPIKRAYERNEAAIAQWLAEVYPKIATRAKRERALIDWGDETGLRSDDVAETWSAAGTVNATGKFGSALVFGEWEDVVDAWNLETWEAYRDVRRLGRKTWLSEAKRAGLWSIFEAVRTRLHNEGLTTHAAMFTRLNAFSR